MLQFVVDYEVILGQIVDSSTPKEGLQFVVDYEVILGQIVDSSTPKEGLWRFLEWRPRNPPA